jgi:small-conductance mechanosensitive channel
MDTEILVKIGIGVGLLVLYVIIVNTKSYWIRRYGRKKDIDPKRTAIVNKLTTLLVFITLVVAEAITWGVHISGIYIFATSFFTMVAIGFFATWSVLSNVTASILIFFLFPYKIDDRVEVVGEDIAGTITDITLFHIIVRGDKGDVVTIPTNLAIQKSIRIVTTSA